MILSSWEKFSWPIHTVVLFCGLFIFAAPLCENCLADGGTYSEWCSEKEPRFPTKLHSNVTFLFPHSVVCYLLLLFQTLCLLSSLFLRLGAQSHQSCTAVQPATSFISVPGIVLCWLLMKGPWSPCGTLGFLMVKEPGLYTVHIYWYHVTRLEHDNNKHLLKVPTMGHSLFIIYYTRYFVHI